MGMRPFVVATAALGSAGVLLLTGCSIGWDGRNTATDDNTVEQAFSAVRIAGDQGSIKIRTGSKSTVHRTIRYDKNKPGTTHRVEGSTLVVEACRERNCRIDYELTVPPGTRVDGSIDSGSIDVDGASTVNVKMDSGSTTVRHVSGKVNVDSSSGSVDVADVGDTVVVRADSGRVKVADVRAPVTVEVESGIVNVGIATPQDVRVRADSGNISVSVPQGQYRVRTQTDSGQIDNNIGDQPSGTHQLDLHTDSGNITVSYA